MVDWFNDIMRKPNCQCFICKKEIYRRPAQIESSKVYCSIKCSGVDQRKNKKCPVCFKEFTGVKKNCSRSCSNKNRTGITYDGKNLNNKYVKGTLLKEQLANINGGVCEECGNDNFNILHVHHKIERCNGGTDELDNLNLLCPNCHYTHHHGYGKWEMAGDWGIDPHAFQHR